MALNLHPLIIGEPDWRALQPGEPTETLDQWYNLREKAWKTLPWFTENGFVTRLENNYRRPVTRRAKRRAIWAALPKWFNAKVLRRRAK
jgi:hypothetical protein